MSDSPTSDIGMMYRQLLQSRGAPLTAENMRRVVDESRRTPGLIPGLTVQGEDTPNQAAAGMPTQPGVPNSGVAPPMAPQRAVPLPAPPMPSPVVPQPAPVAGPPVNPAVNSLPSVDQIHPGATSPGGVLPGTAATPSSPMSAGPPPIAWQHGSIGAPSPIAGGPPPVPADIAAQVLSGEGGVPGQSPENVQSRGGIPVIAADAGPVRVRPMGWTGSSSAVEQPEQAPPQMQSQAQPGVQASPIDMSFTSAMHPAANEWAPSPQGATDSADIAQMILGLAAGGGAGLAPLWAQQNMGNAGPRPFTINPDRQAPVRKSPSGAPDSGVSVGQSGNVAADIERPGNSPTAPITSRVSSDGKLQLEEGGSSGGAMTKSNSIPMRDETSGPTIRGQNQGSGPPIAPAAPSLDRQAQLNQLSRRVGRTPSFRGIRIP